MLRPSEGELLLTLAGMVGKHTEKYRPAP